MAEKEDAMKILIEQETALHQYEIRHNSMEVKRLLHPQFKEVGRSGITYDFTTTAQLMAKEQPAKGHLHAQEFECITLQPSVQLLLYKSAWIDDAGNASAFAKRSSTWIFTGLGWQMIYHQGTPCEAFAIVKS